MSASAPDDLGVVVAYFNAGGFKSKRLNYLRFAESLRNQGVQWLGAECAFGDAEFELGDSSEVVRVRGRDVMWQRERLLNVAESRLPPRCTKIAWLDCDVLFENADWAARASEMLESHDVVQLFDRVVHLPRGDTSFRGAGEEKLGVVAAAASGVVRGGRHGHTGFAWAARRDLFEGRGFYDGCVVGGADHAMAHAFLDHLDAPCIDRLLGRSERQRRHFEEWARRGPRGARARTGFLPGRLFTLWHGDLNNRRYGERYGGLAAQGFDPYGDVRVGAQGAWDWSSDKPLLHRWTADYFASRKEDG